jgi:iron complex outermembrane receptor protein
MMRFKTMRLSGSTAALALMAFATPVAGYAQERSIAFNVPAQSLGSALRAFGQASNQQIMFSEDSVRGMTSSALVGSYTVDDGLQRLLANSGLSVNRTSSGVIVVREANRVELSEQAPGPGAEIVVTGTRIRDAAVAAAAPIISLSETELLDRGFVNVAQLLNQVSSNTPSFPISTTQGFPGGNAKIAPNLFNLGAGRTLTLVNGRRFVATSSGLSDRSVDSSVIPSGLIQRVDVVQAGGAVVYGTDAIAGVVNFVLKRDFTGLVIDVQDGFSSRNDYGQQSIRATAGTNFADGRGNIAVAAEYSATQPLLEADRPSTGNGLRSVTNPANTSTTDGQPPTIYVFDGHLWQYNTNGVIFAANSALPTSLLGYTAGTNTTPSFGYQFSADGQSVIRYNAGAIQGLAPSFASTAVGGEGFDTRNLSTLAAGQQRINGSVIGHYDLTDQVTVSGEFLWSRQTTRDPYGTQQVFRTIANGIAIPFTRTNPFLTASQVTTLSGLSPAFAAGGTLYSSRFMDILPTRDRPTETDTWRAVVAVDGKFEAWGTKFYANLSASRGFSSYVAQVYAPYTTRINNALSAAIGTGGQIVCAINADAITTNDDPACIPINPFGNTPVTAAQSAYISALTGSRNRNTQDDFLATLGGELFKIPAGRIKFSLAYEHREEKAEFIPFEADRLGLTSTAVVGRDASFRTDEISAELAVPLVGGDFTLPFVKLLEVNGAYRYAANSIAGNYHLWSVGARWEPGFGLTFRGTKSRNFRAPSLDQLYQPTIFSPGNPLGSDPCDADRINGGPAPAVRLANCQALFAANPGYGPLATFQDPAENTGILTIQSGGNPALKNEVSDTTTYGVAFQPDYIPGLTIMADRVEVDLKDGLSSLSVAAIAALCYDSTPQPTAICNTFTRNAQGWIIAGQSTVINAARTIYQGEVFSFNYRMPLADWFKGNYGVLTLGWEGTHTSRYESSSTGFNLGRADGTTAFPEWRMRFDVRYALGPVRLFYSAYYLPSSRSGLTDTIETTPVPVIEGNTTHSASVQYDVTRNFTLRAGVNNFTDQQPSFPTRNYGDPFGRQFFIGARAKF